MNRGYSMIIEKGEKFALTEKQKKQLAAWNPSPETKAILTTLQV